MSMYRTGCHKCKDCGKWIKWVRYKEKNMYCENIPHSVIEDKGFAFGNEYAYTLDGKKIFFRQYSKGPGQATHTVFKLHQCKKKKEVS